MLRYQRSFLIILAGILFFILAACGTPTSSPEIDAAEDGSSSAADGSPVGLLPPANIDGAETILIPAATFWMGSEEGDVTADTDEMPRHEVTLSSFYIYTHEVTNAMYTECVAAGACRRVYILESGPTSHYSDPAFADFPVVGVNYVDARNYCEWAGGRLPTEAEWELASRGAESLPYPWGADEPDCTRVNMIGCLVPPDTTAVGSYTRGNSPDGLWDMSGNVWEWVNDWYAEEFYALSPTTNPIGPYSYQDPDHPLRVVRGGGLFSEPDRMRSAGRVGANPYRAYDDVGFRCVVGDLELPRTYDPGADRHEMVPPDPLDPGGEHVEDPDPDEPLGTSGLCLVSCPSPESTMNLFCEVESSEPTEYSMTVNGNSFDCYYDEMLRGLQCEGPIPDNNEELFFYSIEVTADTGAEFSYSPLRPDTCPAGAAAPAIFTPSVGCPEDDGLFTVTFNYEPPTHWTEYLYMVDGAWVAAPCWEISETQAYCVIPVQPDAWAYHIELTGISETGEIVTHTVDFALPESCPHHQRPFTAGPFCFEDRPTVQFTLEPDQVLESVSVGDVPLSCFAMADGVWICGDLPGEPGSDVNMSFCLEGDPCFGFTMPVPECGSPNQANWINITPGCYETIGSVVMIEYPLDILALVSATANGSALTCIDSPSGAYLCYVVPGEPGDTVTVEFCVDDGRCFSQDVVVEDCTGPVGWDEPNEADWEMGATGCHSETQIFFMFDTGLEWLVPGSGFSYTASDGTVDFVCSLIEAVPGRMYCTGDRPDSPGTLEVCLQAVGDPAPICGSFPDFPAWVAMIPSCEAPPEQPVDPCPGFLDPSSCSAAGCFWHKMTNTCESIPE